MQFFLVKCYDGAVETHIIQTFVANVTVDKEVPQIS